jgi:replicative DNA helicase
MAGNTPGRRTTNANKNSVLSAEFGKIPPQALDLEEAVLGALMLEKDAVITVLDLLKPETFYKETNQKIYNAIVQLSAALMPIDLMTVTEQLRKNKDLDIIGGPYALAQLTNKVASAAHVEIHARIIAQKYIQRELIRVSSDIQNRAFDESIDVDDLLDFSEAALFEIAQGNIKKESTPISVLVKEATKQMQESALQPDGLVGVPSGFTQLDRMTNGWQKSDLIIIAARPSMGKTAFILSMTRNMASDYKRPIAIFSLEMSSLQLCNRLISSETELGSEKIRTGKLTDEEWKQFDSKIGNLEDAPIYIDDTPAISVFELRAKCRRLKSLYDIQMIIIDYLQLMTGTPETRGNREQEVSTISRSLKGLAKELNIPVIALSQLNRSVEMRTGNKRPQLSDLRESGAIEQDADMVLFIHRPEKYGLLEFEDGASSVGMAEVIVAKHRNGALGDVRLQFKDSLAKFCDPDMDMSFGGGDIPAPMPVAQTVTVGSRMNADDGAPAANNMAGFSANFDFNVSDVPF